MCPLHGEESQPETEFVRKIFVGAVSAGLSQMQ